MRRLLFCFVLLIICGHSNALSQDRGDAGQAGEFLRWGVGARALGLGRAYTSIAEDASALYWNPAGLGSLTEIGATVMFMHTPLTEGASFNYLAGGIPVRMLFVKQDRLSKFQEILQNIDLGIGAVWVSYGEIDLYDDVGRNQGQESFGQSAFMLSMAYPMTGLFRWIPTDGLLRWAKSLEGDLSLGITGKLIRQGLFGSGGSGTGLDVGLRYTHRSGAWRLGLIYRDLTDSRISYGTEAIADRIPATATAGVAWIPTFEPWMRGFVFSVDYTVAPAGSRKREVMYGLEYDFSKWVSKIPFKVRLGGNSEHEKITFGISFVPEVTAGKDWIPSADWAYGEERGGFDAIGARYSFSFDFDPLSARYWYQRGVRIFSTLSCRGLLSDRAIEEARRNLEKALRAKNPDKRAYRFEAALRLADLNFLQTIDQLRQDAVCEPALAKTDRRSLQDVLEAYTSDLVRYDARDAGKTRIDTSMYVNSFLYYIQALILSGAENDAIAHCEARGQRWGRMLDLGDRHTLGYLKRYAELRKDGTLSDDETLSDEDPDALPLPAGYLSANALVQQGQYQQAIDLMGRLDLNESEYAEGILLPLSGDCHIGDDLLYLKAMAMKQLSGEYPPEAYRNELAKIPRFFPMSDILSCLPPERERALLFTLFAEFERRAPADLAIK